MKNTKNLGLPIYDNPKSDLFKISDVNNAHTIIDETYEAMKNAKDHIVEIDKNIPIKNADAEIVDARRGKSTLGDKIREIDSSLENIVRDEVVSNSSAWSSEKTREQIALIPKGEKGEPGVASVSIDDEVENTTQTWTSSKIRNEVESLSLACFNKDVIFDDVFTKISTTTNNGGQIMLLYDLGEITQDTMVRFESNIFSEFALGDMYINVFGNNSSTITDLSGGYSITNINPKTYKTGSVMSLNANFIAKADYRYLRILIRFQGVNPVLYLYEKFKDKNNIDYNRIGLNGFNVAINLVENNRGISNQLIRKSNLEDIMNKTLYFENKFLEEKNKEQIYESVELNITSALDKTFYIVVFDMQKYGIDLNSSNNLEVTYDGVITSNIQATNYTVNVYASSNNSAKDINTDSIIIQQTSLTNAIDNGSFTFNKLYDNRNLQGKRYLKLLVTTNFTSNLTNVANIMLSNLKLKVNSIYCDFYDSDVYEINGVTGTVIKKIGDNEFVKYKELNKLTNDIVLQTNNHWKDKTWRQFGDSITWQDGHSWGKYDKVDQIARGYQTVVKELLLIGRTINSGASDTTISNVNAGQGSMWKAFFENGCPDLTGVDLITIAHGTNDYASNVVIGEIGNIDDIAFDNTTYYGAYRDILTKIITNYPNIRIVLCTPIQKATKILPNSAGHVLLDYVNAIRKIGEMYGLPVCDFYSNSGLNYLNHATYYPDKVHPNEAGYELMGRCLAGVIKNC